MIWKIEVWLEELVYGFQKVAYQPETLIWSGQLSGSVSNLFYLFHFYSRVLPPK